MASVAELKRRAREINVEIPADIVEKSELIRFVEDAEERARGTTVAAGPDADYTKSKFFSPTGAQGRSNSVAELKARLRELNLEVPTTIVEKSELQELVEEAERQRAQATQANPAPVVPSSKAPTATDQLPHPWYAQESRSKPGRFYYVNGQTGETTWKRPEPEVATQAEHQFAAAVSSGNAEASSQPQDLPKHDYRDDAFGGSIQKSDEEVVMSGRAWSRSNSMSVQKGPQRRVSLLHVGAANDDAPRTDALLTSPTRRREHVVTGSQMTWIRGEMIGRGSLGKVFRATDASTGQVIAVKEVPIDTNDDTDLEFRTALENEIEIMRELKHPHILAYLGHDYLNGSVFIYLEHMPGGTLTQALQQYGPFEESLIARYSKQLLDGLEYMHTRSPSVVHRDIKGSNTLIAMDGRAKLADFGCSKRAQKTLTHTMRGSIPWMAPEVIAHSRHGLAADIWSFGCVAIEMGTAKTPWGHFDNQMAALVKIGMSQETPPMPEGLSESCVDFIRGCVARDPAARPSASELQHHELVRDIPSLDE